jgi:hypothetical protein
VEILGVIPRLTFNKAYERRHRVMLRLVEEVGKIIGIEVLAHLIVNANAESAAESYSLKERDAGA